MGILVYGIPLACAARYIPLVVEGAIAGAPPAWLGPVSLATARASHATARLAAVATVALTAGGGIAGDTARIAGSVSLSVSVRLICRCRRCGEDGECCRYHEGGEEPQRAIDQMHLNPPRCIDSSASFLCPCYVAIARCRIPPSSTVTRRVRYGSFLDAAWGSQCSYADQVGDGPPIVIAL